MSATATSAPQNKSLEWLNRLRANPKIPLMVAAAAAVAIVVAMVLWAKSPDYRTLYSNLSDQDGGAIVTQLTQMNIPYRFSENGGAIEVPADKVHELRLRLAQQGLPKGGAVGFELLDQEKFGISQFSEQVNYQRALEGELARTIETLGPVKTARVHLAMPKPSLFVREQKSPSASITVNLAPGRAMDDGQITAIVHLVSSAVAGLPPGNVTVVDQSGRLLTQSNTAGRDLNDAQLKYASDVESRVQRRIESILRQSWVTVTSTLRLPRRLISRIKNKPKSNTSQTAMPLRQYCVLARPTKASRLAEVIRAAYRVRCLTSLPRPMLHRSRRHRRISRTDSKIKWSADGLFGCKHAVPRNTTRNETANYEVDRTIRHTKMNVGDIERLSGRRGELPHPGGWQDRSADRRPA
jgi:flagellar M-ring protein FliF